MKLMILEKVRVIRTCSSSPRAASVFAIYCKYLEATVIIAQPEIFALRF
jgi:hypothetical protein